MAINENIPFPGTAKTNVNAGSGKGMKKAFQILLFLKEVL